MKRKMFLALILSFAISVPVQGMEYTVKKGDNLWRLSKQYNFNIDEVVKTNNIKNPRLIYTGQTLILPDKEITETPIAAEIEKTENTEEIKDTVKNIETGKIKIDDLIDTAFTKDVMFTISDFGDDPATGNRSSGSKAEKETANYIYSKMEEVGLKNITIDAFKADGWTFNGANIKIAGENGEEIIHLGGYATEINANDEKLKLVYANKGTQADLAKLDVKGKLVLVDIDQHNEWWINWPAYEAYLKGAYGVIAVNIASYAQYDDDTIGSQDICGPEYAKAMAISKNNANKLKDLIEKSENKEIEVTFNAKSTITKGSAISQNVWGEIPGKTDEVIYFIAHYDGYYHSAFDDASGVASILTIAKAINESGYMPEKTIRFVTHGAEEWGKTDSAYDWSIGAYNQIMNIHPEWAENAFAMINIDGCYPLIDENVLAIRSNYELKDFADKYITTVPTTNGKIEIYNSAPPTTGTEDFIYSQNGVPVIAAVSFHDKSNSVYRDGAYHSSADNKKLGFNEEYSKYSSAFFLNMALLFDHLPLKPLNFNSHMEYIKSTFNESYTPESLYAEFAKAEEAISFLTKNINRLNEEYVSLTANAKNEEAAQLKLEIVSLNKDLYEIFKFMQQSFVKLGWAENKIAPHVNAQDNIIEIEQIIDLLKSGDAQTALDEHFYNIDYNWYAYDWSKEAYDYFTNQYRQNAKGTFGEGLVEKPNEDLYDVIKSLNEKTAKGDTDFSAEITAMKKALENQKGYLMESYSKEEADIRLLTEKIIKINTDYSNIFK